MNVKKLKYLTTSLRIWKNIDMSDYNLVLLLILQLRKYYMSEYYLILLLLVKLRRRNTVLSD